MQDMTKRLKAVAILKKAIETEETPTREYIKERFESEYGHEIERRGIRFALVEWLMGLALHVPFYTVEIEELGFEDGKNRGQYWYELGTALHVLLYMPESYK